MCRIEHGKTFSKRLYNRRKIIEVGFSFLACAALGGCKELSYKRKDIKIRLGRPSYLIHPQQFIREAGVIVFRKEKGWSTMSARCSREGCDLSDNGSRLSCPCCKSIFDYNGKVLYGEAKYPLAWYKMSYNQEQSLLLADGTAGINSKEIFTTSKLEEEIATHMVRFQKEGPSATLNVPEVVIDPDSARENPILTPTDSSEIKRLRQILENDNAANNIKKGGRLSDPTVPKDVNPQEPIIVEVDPKLPQE